MRALLPRQLVTSAAVILLFLLPAFSVAQEEVSPAWQDWQRVESLAPGRFVIVKRARGLGPDIKGMFVAAQSDALTLESRDGQVVIARDEVRKVRARRGAMIRRAQWIGLAAGFTVGALLVAGEGDFNQPSATFAFGSGGGALGYLGGLAVRGLGRNALIYRAP